MGFISHLIETFSWWSLIKYETIAAWYVANCPVIYVYVRFKWLTGHPRLMGETNKCELISGRWWVCLDIRTCVWKSSIIFIWKTRACHDASHALRKAIVRQLYRGLFVDQEKWKRVFSSYFLLTGTRADKAIYNLEHKCKRVDFGN